jgi:hypothetical protein
LVDGGRVGGWRLLQLPSATPNFQSPPPENVKAILIGCAMMGGQGRRQAKLNLNWRKIEGGGGNCSNKKTAKALKLTQNHGNFIHSTPLEFIEDVMINN